MKQQIIQLIARKKIGIHEGWTRGFDRHYEKGYDEALQELLSEIEKMEEWIPVSEKKPDGDEEFIILTSSGIVSCAAWWTDKDNWIVGNTPWDNSIFGKITHWQPLPQPPNQPSNV